MCRRHFSCCSSKSPCSPHRAMISCRRCRTPVGPSSAATFSMWSNTTGPASGFRSLTSLSNSAPTTTAVAGSMSAVSIDSATAPSSGRRSSFAAFATVGACRRACQPWSATHAVVDAACDSSTTPRTSASATTTGSCAKAKACSSASSPTSSRSSTVGHWKTTVCRSRSTSAQPAMICRRSANEALPSMNETLPKGYDSAPTETELIHTAPASDFDLMFPLDSGCMYMGGGW